MKGPRKQESHTTSCEDMSRIDDTLDGAAAFLVLGVLTLIAIGLWLWNIVGLA